VLVVFSTSGESRNILSVLEAAKSSQTISIGFLGRDGGKAASLVDVALTVANQDVERIQECHQFLVHTLMDRIEACLRA